MSGCGLGVRKRDGEGVKGGEGEGDTREHCEIEGWS